MSGWAIVAVVAIVVWGIVQMSKARHGITTDEYGNENYVDRHDPDAPSRAEIEDTRREIDQLRERLHVLERIATDNNSLDARERARISAEIEALREPLENSGESSVTKTTPTLSKEEQSK
jgi:hypothetical protein